MSTELRNEKQLDEQQKSGGAPMYEIRPFEEADRAAVVEFQNQGYPAHRRHTVAEWERSDSRRTGKEVYRRLVAGSPAIAYLEVVDASTTSWKMEAVCEMELHVAHEHRNKGMGGALYEQALEFARERNARRMVTWFMEHSPDEPAHAFLQHRGFKEQEREKGSSFDLAAFDFTPYEGVIEQVEQSGVHIFAYGDLEDNEENRRKLYDLVTRLTYDIPRRDTQPFIMPPFEEWIKHNLDRPEWAPDATILAEVDGKWVGISQLMFKEGSNIGMTWLTGVLKEYRGRHIATALKLRAFEVARKRGCPVITTENHEDNGPMLAINRKFGFVPDPPYVVYNKVLREEVTGTNE
jgi:GNAT superfamily N-acetyltransferase